MVVANGASFQEGAPVAPGCYAQVFGDFAGFPTTTTDISSLPLPTTLEGVQVMVEGVAAPLYAVRPDLVAFIVPQATTLGQHTIQVILNGQVIGQGPVNVVGAFPGVFFGFGSDGTAIGGIRRTTDYAYAVDGTPASRGSAIAIALTGQGNNVDNPPADGEAPVGPESQTKVKPRVFIAGVEANVIFSGLFPNFPGLWQVNAVIPDDAFIAGAVPLVVTFNNVPSNTVFLWVAE